MHIVPAPGLLCFENSNRFWSRSSIIIIRWSVQIKKNWKKCNRALGIWSIHQQVGLDSKGGTKILKNPLRPIVFEILELNFFFFSYSNKIKAQFRKFLQWNLCLKTIRILIQCTLSLHLACYALRIPTDFGEIQVSSSSSGGQCR